MDKLIEKAIAKLVIKHAFISSILLSTEVVEDKTLPFSGATDGNKIIVNPDKLREMAQGDETLALEYATFMMAHEVYHIALMHPFRRGKRDAVCIDASGQQVTVWNLACDAPVNEMLNLDGFKIPKGCMRMPGAEDKSAEEIYDELMKQFKKNKKVQYISMDDLQDNKPDESNGDQPSSGSSSAQEMKAKIKIQKALDIAKAVGKLPASLQRLVEDAMESKIPWQELLRDSVTTIMKKEDYTWSRLNRRYVWNNVYMPGMHGEKTGPIFLAFDTSGSVGSKELASFLGEMNAIFEDVNPEKIMVGFCDCSFYGPHTELEEDQLPMQAKDFSKITKGGGGTAFSPVFDYIKDTGLQPEMVIYFTDLCGNDFGSEPNYPVLWVSTHSTEAPWGKVIKLDL